MIGNGGVAENLSGHFLLWINQDIDVVVPLFNETETLNSGVASQVTLAVILHQNYRVQSKF